jgi:hypothetical protein
VTACVKEEGRRRRSLERLFERGRKGNHEKTKSKDDLLFDKEERVMFKRSVIYTLACAICLDVEHRDAPIVTTSGLSERSGAVCQLKR